MSEITPTRSAVIALVEERRAMHDSYVFLDEKCLLLAEAMMKELRRYEGLAGSLRAALGEAAAALHSALARHGLEGLQCYPAVEPRAVAPSVTQRRLMGVLLQAAELDTAGRPPYEPVNPSPEAEACREQYARVAALGAQLAAVAGNLERLYHEYRRSVRRVRALQDVLLPEIDRTVNEIETRLEELEQDEALWLRYHRRS
ncbi:MAG: V-type ATP synthase subunit D [Betaproteobacteria bacterium]|nr:V-type ATP synthase subunit D [Betaproteobacteria bacterium]